MQKSSDRLFDQLAKFITDCTSITQDAKGEVDKILYSQFEKFITRMDLVSRDEFEVVRDIASRTRMENDTLKKELEILKKMILDLRPAENEKSTGNHDLTDNLPSKSE
ncbi:accessory factor UbiK family protein [Candidatus Endowatersipora endosymbiont of Watersipora subatra]|uniref:accessory factor UbiK family protein n=1 Tax=Candidatus Endowatersipora endosymbiont of Watersipora subatra TaxID=3077946 RepID=UPI00312CA1B4